MAGRHNEITRFTTATELQKNVEYGTRTRIDCRRTLYVTYINGVSGTKAAIVTDCYSFQLPALAKVLFNSQIMSRIHDTRIKGRIT